jgi:hypothetical protein
MRAWSRGGDRVVGDVLKDALGAMAGGTARTLMDSAAAAQRLMREREQEDRELVVGRDGCGGDEDAQ